MLCSTGTYKIVVHTVGYCMTRSFWPFLSRIGKVLLLQATCTVRNFALLVRLPWYMYNRLRRQKNRFQFAAVGEGGGMPFSLKKTLFSSARLHFPSTSFRPPGPLGASLPPLHFPTLNGRNASSFVPLAFFFGAERRPFNSLPPLFRSGAEILVIDSIG